MVMPMLSNISLPAPVRDSLRAFQDLQSQVTLHQKRLTTGKKVSDILDDPIAFFKSQSLYSRADSLLQYKAGIDQGISVLKATTQGLDAYSNILRQIKGLAEQSKNASVTEQASLQIQATKLLASTKSLLYDTNINGTNLLYQDTQGVVFDGVNDVLNPNETIGTNTNFTMSVWVNTTKDGDIGSFGGSTLPRIAGGKVYFQASLGAGAVSGSTTVTDGNWHRIVMVHDVTNSKETIYVDGKLDGQAAATGAFSVAGINSLGFSTSNGIYFTGGMDDFQFWKGATAAWDANDAAYDYATNNPPSSRAGTALLASQMSTRLQFSEGAGTSTANSGTIGGSVGIGATITPNINSFWAGAKSNSQPFGTTLTIPLSDNNNYTIQGVNMTPQALGVSLSFQSANINATIASLDSAISTVNAQSGRYATDFNFLKMRMDYNQAQANTLQEAGDKLTLADLNEEAADLLALQTRQQFAIQSMALTFRLQRKLLDLFQ